MFDIGWSELLVIGVVALVVIGPKDLPKVLKVVGYWVRRARETASEFQSNIEQMVRDSELEEMRKKMEAATNFDLAAEVDKIVDPDKTLSQALDVPFPTDPQLPAPGGADPVIAPPSLAASPDLVPEPEAEPAPKPKRKPRAKAVEVDATPEPELIAPPPGEEAPGEETPAPKPKRKPRAKAENADG